jgi:hypothetical protein
LIGSEVASLQPCVDAVAALNTRVAVDAAKACGVLQDISALPAGQEACISVGAVPALVAVLKAPRYDPKDASYWLTDEKVGDWEWVRCLVAVNRGACGALANISLLSAGQDACVAAGAVPAIAQIISSFHPPSRHAQPCLWQDMAEDAFATLRNIAMLPSGREACLKAGLAATRHACSLFREAALEQFFGMLQNIVAGDGCEKPCVDAGALEELVYCINRYPTAGAAEHACRALWCIVTDACCVKPCVDAGAVRAVVLLLKKNLSVAAVAEPACGVLWSIAASDDPSYRDAIVRAGAAPLLAAAFGAHSGDAQEAAHGALEALGFDDAGAPIPDAVIHKRDAVARFHALLSASPERAALLPRVLLHISHPHALVRGNGHYSAAVLAYCDGCGKRQLEFSHHCAGCRFDLCDACFACRELGAAALEDPPSGAQDGQGASALRAAGAKRSRNDGLLRAHCVAMLAHKGSGSLLAGSKLAVLEGGALVSGGSSFICTWAHGADRGLKSIAGAAASIAALPGGRFATAGGSENLVEVWDAGSGQRLYQLRGHTDSVYCVAALPKGLLASGSGDKTVRIWDTATGAFVAALEGHMGHKDAVYLLAALPDYRLASVGRKEDIIRIWNVVTRACTQVLKLTYQLTPREPYPGFSRVYALVVLDGGRLACGGSDERIHILSLAGAGVQEAVLDGHKNSVDHLAALPNGLLASGSCDGTVRVWDVGARACVAVFEKRVNALAALPDGRLVSYYRDGVYTDRPELRVWALTAPDTPEDAAAAAVAAACVEVAPGPA